MVADDSSDNTLRVSKQHNVSFYVRAATNFLQGVTGKDGLEKKIFESIVVSALGAAIPTAATVASLLESKNVGKVSKIQTLYAEMDFGKRPQIMVTVDRNPDYVAPVKVEKGKAPAMPDRLNDEKLDKKMKKVVKEGGKRGVEIEGAADMGGLKYFCTKVLEPSGDLDMLVESVKAMNAKSDPSEEERKGGSGHIGKTVWSMQESKDDANNLSIVCYVPETEECDAQDWLKDVLEKLGAKGVSPREDSNGLYAQVCIQNNNDTGVFCIKLRDYVIQHANAFLRNKGLIPEVEDDSEDEMVFGDDDFEM